MIVSFANFQGTFNAGVRAFPDVSVPAAHPDMEAILRDPVQGRRVGFNTTNPSSDVRR